MVVPDCNAEAGSYAVNSVDRMPVFRGMAGSVRASALFSTSPFALRALKKPRRDFLLLVSCERCDLPLNLRKLYLCARTTFSAWCFAYCSTSRPGRPAVSFESMKTSPGTSRIGESSGEEGSDCPGETAVGAVEDKGAPRGSSSDEERCRSRACVRFLKASGCHTVVRDREQKRK